MKIRPIYLNLIGSLFVILGVLSIVNSLLILHNPGQLLWFCYIGLLILGIGTLTRNGFLVMALLDLLIVPLIFWNFDFFYNLITGTPFLGLTEYFFTPGRNFGKYLSLQHIITIPLGIFCLYWIRPKRRDAWKISVAIISSFYVLTIFLTDSLQNVNCAFRACGQIQVSQGYPFLWFGLFIMSILVTNLVLSRIFVQGKKKINQPSRS